MKMKKMFYMMFLLVFTGCVNVILKEYICANAEYKKYQAMIIESEFYRDYFYSDKMLSIKEHLSDECKTILANVEKEASYYPIPESSVDKSLKTSYVNTWMSERNYGGKRGHEGVDIMASENISGIYPVLSITDGVVTNLGWLEKGGYRVGITSESGTYYYYAHLDSYANISEGDFVKAGDLLGYMGDSGYGTEGTKGKFAVHLHLGIYCYKNGEEISLNPYYLLLKLENKKLKYTYS